MICPRERGNLFVLGGERGAEQKNAPRFENRIFWHKNPVWRAENRNASPQRLWGQPQLAGCGELLL